MGVLQALHLEESFRSVLYMHRDRAAKTIQRMWRMTRPRKVQGKNLRLVFAHSMITSDDKQMTSFPKGSMLIFLGQCTKKMKTSQFEVWKHILSNPVLLQKFIEKHPGAVYTDRTVKPIDVKLHFRPNPGQTNYMNIGVWNLKTRGSRPLTGGRPAGNVATNVLNRYKNFQGKVVQLSDIVTEENTIYIVTACRVLVGFNVNRQSIRIGEKTFPVKLPDSRTNMSTQTVLNRLRAIPRKNLNTTSRRLLQTAIRAQELNKAATRHKRFTTRGEFLNFIRNVRMNANKNQYATTLRNHLSAHGGFTSANKQKITQFIQEVFKNNTLYKNLLNAPVKETSPKVSSFRYINKNTTHEIRAIVNKIAQHVRNHKGVFQTGAQKNTVALFLMKLKNLPNVGSAYKYYRVLKRPNPSAPLFNVSTIPALSKRL